MDAVSTVEGRAYPFGMKNVDTDMIIAAKWLKTISRSGLGKGAFEALRQDPENVFDNPAYAGAPIIIAGDNFGCGSSREHAAWALADMGVKAVIAPSFRSEEHTSELQSLMRISYAVFCLKKKKHIKTISHMYIYNILHHNNI